MAVITISRQFGAGGETLGLMLAKELNYRFLDDVVIHALARRINVTHEAVRDMENIAGGFFSRVVSAVLSRNYMERLTGEDFGYIDQVIYLRELKAIITDLAEEDNVIFLGRGAQYVLVDHPNTFHLLLVEQKRDRIEFMRNKYGLSPEVAEKTVNEGEKRRVKLYSLFKASDFNEPLLYHMVLNTGRVSHAQAMQQVATLVRSSG